MRDIMNNTHRRRLRDSTRQMRRVASVSAVTAVCIGLYVRRDVTWLVNTPVNGHVIAGTDWRDVPRRRHHYSTTTAATASRAVVVAVAVVVGLVAVSAATAAAVIRSAACSMNKILQCSRVEWQNNSYDLSQTSRRSVYDWRNWTRRRRTHEIGTTPVQFVHSWLLQRTVDGHHYVIAGR